MEAKLRTIVHEILKPVVDRAHDDREQIFKTWDYSQKTTARIDNIDGYLFKNDKDTDLANRKVNFENGDETTGVIDMRPEETRKKSTKIDELEMRFDMLKSQFVEHIKSQ